MMVQSPFVYFRGAAPVMAADLAVIPNTGIVSQLCGDAARAQPGGVRCNLTGGWFLTLTIR